MLNKFLLTVLLSIALLTSTGCVHAIFSGDPLDRNQELLNKSEDMRNIRGEWRRFWMLDQPSHMTPDRVHGGIM